MDATTDGISPLKGENVQGKQTEEKPFSLVLLGWACVIVTGILIALIVWMSWTVVSTLTQPQPFLQKYLDDPATKKDLGAEMAIALEYESMAVRSQGLQLAFGFVVGLVFLAIGLLLFAVGA